MSLKAWPLLTSAVTVAMDKVAAGWFPLNAGQTMLASTGSAPAIATNALSLSMHTGWFTSEDSFRVTVIRGEKGESDGDKVAEKKRSKSWITCGRWERK